MSLQQFAEGTRTHIRRDGCADLVIPGKNRAALLDRAEYRGHVYDGFSDGSLGLCLMYPTKKRWNNARRKLLAVGFVVRQNGDAEGCATFDPANGQQARLALQLAGVKHRRVLSPAQQAQCARLGAIGRARRLPAPIRQSPMATLETEQTAGVGV
jgi:hypothetical protein